MSRAPGTPETIDVESNAQPARAPLPRWLLGLAPLTLIAVLIALFALLNGPGLSSTDNRVPEEAVVVENIRLVPGQIIIDVRNEGIDPVAIAQVSVSDFYAPFTQTRDEIAPLQSDTLTIDYDWVEADPYEVSMITSTGGRIVAEIDAAVASADKGASFFGLMILLGVYVGVIPIGLGMLWMPFVRRSSGTWVRALIAFTIGLLAYLALDATLEGLELVERNGSFGGSIVVFLGALVAYLALEGVEGFARSKSALARDAGTPLSPQWLATLVAIGIGLHNLGEGLAIGSAYAVGSLALGAFLVIGFAIHNTTEGLAIITPLAGQSPRLRRLALLGLIAGAPAILGAILGATVYQPTVAAGLFGLGAGAIGQVAIKLLPLMKDKSAKALTPISAGALIGGIAFMFLTGLLVDA